MKTVASESGNCTGIRVLNILFFLIVLLLFLVSCSQKPKPYSVAVFEGDDEMGSYSKTYIINKYSADSVYKSAFLAEDGDMFITGSNGLMRFREPFQKKYVVKTTKQACYINGKISTIFIPANDTLVHWIDQLKEEDISSLEFIHFDNKLRESYLPGLTRISKMKPGIGLIYDGYIKDMEPVFKIFKPWFLSVGGIYATDYNILESLPDLEVLSISISDSVYSKPLPLMPKLKHVLLSPPENTIPIRDLLLNNKQVEKLSVFYIEGFDMAVTNPLTNLKELIINGFDTILNFGSLINHKNLEVLVLNGSMVSFDTILAELPKIRWIAFSPYVIQDEFSFFIENHPNLEVVEIIGNDTISNFKPLLKLEKLYGLTIANTLTDFATLKSLKKLTYLSLPRKVLDDTIKKAELQKALPATMLVATEGSCLGSGWLLLILPLALLFSILAMRKRVRTGNS
jgi:hypothetical protein